MGLVKSKTVTKKALLLPCVPNTFNFNSSSDSTVSDSDSISSQENTNSLFPLSHPFTFRRLASEFYKIPDPKKKSEFISSFSLRQGDGGLELFNDDVLSLIFSISQSISFLGLASRVCQRWYNLANENSIWSNFIPQDEKNLIADLKVLHSF